MSIKGVVPFVIAVIVFLPGCPSTLTGDTYRRGEARTAQEVQFGTVESIRSVKIEGTKSGVGATAGGLLGGIAGSNAGGGRGRAAATVGGAVLGGMAGSATEEAVTRTDGIEITVRLDNGRMMAVVQEVSPTEQFRPGERVRILTHGGTARVSH